MNLVSLMDIFTILVFFLLVSQSSVQEIPKDDNLKLPESLAQTPPEETVTVMIARDRILVQNKAVIEMDKVLNSSGELLPAVQNALQKELGKVVVKDLGANDKLQNINIVGDRSVPFSVLQKVMKSCTDMGYTRISLAVLQKSAVGS
ncbi:biopolymer transport protein ExbD/TolR [gamma proteobacterium HTCC5015]|nr:biopolymer transport protein ExbD/TolR [gamma proteobacterium HTCC5015]